MTKPMRIYLACVGAMAAWTGVLFAWGHLLRASASNAAAGVFTALYFYFIVPPVLIAHALGSLFTGTNQEVNAFLVTAGVFIFDGLFGLPVWLWLHGRRRPRSGKWVSLAAAAALLLFAAATGVLAFYCYQASRV